MATFSREWFQNLQSSVHIFNAKYAYEETKDKSIKDKKIS